MKTQAEQLALVEEMISAETSIVGDKGGIAHYAREVTVLKTIRSCDIRAEGPSDSFCFGEALF